MTNKRLRTIIALAIVFSVPVTPATGQNIQDIFNTAVVKAMTLNLYLGADLDAFLDVDSVDELPEVVAETFSTIQQTNFPERAQILADEILARQPELIGLQEAVIIRRQSPGDFFVGNPTDAEEVVFDYLEILLEAMRERGLDYEVASLVENADFELPSETDNLLPDDIRLTDRDVILARKDAVIISDPLSRNYETNLQIPVGFLSIKVPRGFTAVDAKIRRLREVTYRVVNTHLEGRGAMDGVVQSLQATELIQSLEDENNPVILLGDFNSEPDDSLEMGIPPYEQITFSGFTDTWILGGDGGPGFTCCQDKSLTNSKSQHDKRIDHIFFRNGMRNDLDFVLDPAMNPAKTEIIGDDPSNKTPSGLWGSDHCGVVSGLRVGIRGDLSNLVEPRSTFLRNVDLVR